MGGDHMAGLAAAILLVAAAMTVVPAVVAGLAVYLVLRRAGSPGHLARDDDPRAGGHGRPHGPALLAAALAALVAGGLGAMGATATFFESVWSPPSELLLEVPAGFAHDDVVLLEDPAAGAAVEWSGVDAPFVSRSARVSVPASGVARVRSLDALYGRVVEVRLSNGLREWGRRTGPIAPGIGTGVAMVILLRPWVPGQRELPADDPAAFVEEVRARERGGS